MAQAAFVDLLYKYCVECGKLKFTLADVFQLECLELFHWSFSTYRVMESKRLLTALSGGWRNLQHLA